MPSEEIITVTLDGEAFRAWKEVKVTAGVNQAARSFTLTAAAELGAEETARKFKAGKNLTIMANGDLLLTGHVDRYQPRISGKDAHITITGRSRSGDLVDNAALHRTGEFRNRTLVQAAQELARDYGVTVRTDQQLDPGTYRVTPGETVFRFLERAGREIGVALTGEADGALSITRAGKQRMGGSIVEGDNLLEGSADHNFANRYARTIVRGQRPEGTGADNTEIEAEAEDAEVPRGRTTLVVTGTDTSRTRARSRARNRRNRAAGNSLRANVKVQGFRDEGGQLFAPNKLVFLDSPFLQIAQDMLIESVTYAQDASGSIATLSLVDPRAHDSQGSGRASGRRRGRRGRRRGRSRSNSSWNMPSE